ncbi:GntR family transcriptional regulator [Streptomyces acidiscabies]|uniref:GntR family transcriptional regulator n=1 Tax=Streptomyces acidiscabies TaxID=42234 RepID=UPI00095D732C|nr:GntR family transcriptional regulator [Streptomyces acidiscabies]GAV45687.1 putative HTH-type transcriptional regulator [Streptomyces acidiscabies]
MPETARQIADDLRARIDAGEFGPGARLPGEPALVRDYGVAKMTASGALKLLEAEGVAIRRPGSGTYVREFRPILRDATKRLSRDRRESGTSIWSADVGERPLAVTDVEVHEDSAPRWAARALDLNEGMRVVIRSRRYLVDGEPVQTAVSYLPADLVRGSRIMEPDTGPGGLYQRLAELGAEPVRFNEELRARMPSTEESTALSIPPGTPVIEICRTAYTSEGAPVEVNRMLLDAGSYALRYTFDN